MLNPLIFGYDELACALVLTGVATPTPKQLAKALAEMYPAKVGASADEIIASGMLVPTIDGLSLRLPPPSPAEMGRRFYHEDGPQLLARAASGTANGTASGMASGMASGTASGAARGAASGAESGAESGAASGAESGTASGAESGTASGAESGTDTATIAGLFSYYDGPITNTKPRAHITVANLYQVITAPPSRLRERADAARAEYEANGKSSRYRELKNGLDYFTVGGTFTRRQDAALLEPSGLVVLDFDEMGGGVGEARAALLADQALAPALALLFVSPSGDGLKVVLAADPRHDRRQNYERLAQHLTRRYGWGPTLDRKTADISRACFLSHDPVAWIAPELFTSSAA